MNRRERIKNCLSRSGRPTIAGLSMLLLSSTSAFSAEYPSQVIKLIVPFAAGGGTDVLARIVAERLTEGLGQSVIVENIGGAAGAIGTQVGVDSQPDGYTLLFSPTAPYTLSPHLKPAPTYSPKTDLVAIARIAEQPILFAVRSDAGYSTLQDFLDAAKAAPGDLSFSSSGAGGEMHLSGEMLEMTAEIDLIHVAYRGGGAAILGLVTGEVDMMPVVTGSIMPYIKDGAIVALATTAAERLPAFEDVPTTSELGFGQVNHIPSWGVFAPAGISSDIVATLEAAFSELMVDAKFSASIENLSMIPAYLDHVAFTDFLVAQSASFSDLISQSDLGSK